MHKETAVDRIIGKALYSYIKSILPDGLAVKDTISGMDAVIFIDGDGILRIEKTTEIHPDNDLKPCIIINEESMAPSSSSIQ